MEMLRQGLSYGGRKHRDTLKYRRVVRRRLGTTED
jgi:hypothetical protein